MEIQHSKGLLHTKADVLSRTPKRKCKRTNCPDCTEMSRKCQTTHCIDDLNTVKDGNVSCFSVQSVITDKETDNETDGDTDSVRGFLATHLPIRPVNVNTE